VARATRSASTAISIRPPVVHLFVEAEPIPKSRGSPRATCCGQSATEARISRHTRTCERSYQSFDQAVPHPDIALTSQHHITASTPTSLQTQNLIKNRDSSVSTVITLRTGHPRSRGSIPVRGKSLICFRKRPARVCAPLNPLVKV
jgi:hypothetical protein